MQPSVIEFFVIEFFVIAIIFIGPFFVTEKERQRKKRQRLEKERQQLAYIQEYRFPAEILGKLAKQYKNLSLDQIRQVENGLRIYFTLVVRYGYGLAMPSRAVDTLWHEFILFTQAYQAFCDGAFGRFLHHVPFAAMQSPEQVQQAMRNAWLRSCDAEDINPLLPQRLPLLFALDAELGISDGFVYSVEQGIYPRLDIDITPDALREEIESRYLNAKTAAEEQAAINMLAPLVKRKLLDEGYCRGCGGTALVPLFKAVMQFEGLAVAVFGDMDKARQRQQQVKKYPEPTACGCGGGCGG